MKHYLLSLCILIAISACKDKKGDDPKPADLYPCKLTKMSLEARNNGVITSSQVYEYEYDNQNRLIKFKKGPYETVLYDYNEKNQPIRAISTSNNGISIKDFEYDSNNRWVKTVNKITSSISIPKTTVTYVYNYTYDASGNRIKIEYVRPDGTSMYYTFKYENGNLKEQYNSEKKETAFYEYYLDKENKAKLAQNLNSPVYEFATISKNLIKKVDAILDGKRYEGDINTYELNEQGYVTKHSQIATGSFTSTTTFEYSCK